MVHELTNRKSDKAQRAYWNRYVGKLHERLAGLGIEPADIDREVDALASQPTRDIL